MGTRTYGPWQPFADAASVTQLRMQGVRPEVEVGSGEDTELLWACTPANAAARVRAESVLNFIAR